MAKRGIIVAVVVGATLAFIATRRGGGPKPPRAQAASPSSAADRLAAVERVVNDKNKEVGDEARKFEADGWKMVSASPPDERLTHFDPALLGEGRESELRVQLASTVANPRNVHAIGQIVLLAKDPATREAATDALGHVGTDNAREELMTLLTSGKLDPDDLGRRQIAAYLRPTDLDDPAAAKIAGLIDAPGLVAAERQQIAFNLALVGLRDGMTLTEPVLASLSPGARALIDQMTELGSSSFLAHSHTH